jgi:uncharacterized protein YegP (UPF0339 family)
MDGRISGIDPIGSPAVIPRMAVKPGRATVKYVIYQDTMNRWRWHLITVTGSVLAYSGRDYETYGACHDAVTLVKNAWGVEIKDGYEPDRSLPYPEVAALH